VSLVIGFSGCFRVYFFCKLRRVLFVFRLYKQANMIVFAIGTWIMLLEYLPALNLSCQ
jgi:hypothetical protein